MMGGYTNGRFPLSMMIKLGPEHYLPPGTAARWAWLVRQCLAKYGVTLYITGGWNAYRPYDVQVQYRKDLGIMAAVPGRSSHGLIYQGRLCAAIDVANWGVIGWARFKALCRLAGFTVDFVKPQELWHIGDFNDIWAVPAAASVDVPVKPTTTAPIPEPAPSMEDIMAFKSIAIAYRPGGKPENSEDPLESTALDWEDGAKLPLHHTPLAYTKSFSEKLTEGGLMIISEGHYNNVLAAFDAHQAAMRDRELELARIASGAATV